MTTTTPRTRTTRAPRAKAAVAKAVVAEPRVDRIAQREFVRLGLVRVNPIVQREFVPSKADRIAAEFDPEHFGTPVVNMRGGHAWVIDGQHRVEALKMWLGEGWEDQHFEAEVYTDLTEAQEADAFLRRNDAMAVNAFNKFRIAVVAGWEDEQTVSGIVLREGLTITRDRDHEGRILAVGTLLRIYRRAGGDVLARTLAIIRDAYGTAGLDAPVLAGMSMVVHRYDRLDDKEMVKRLTKAHGGLSGMLGKADREKKSSGNPRQFCVAAAIVDTFNSQSAESKGGNGTKMLSWWKAAAE